MTCAEALNWHDYFWTPARLDAWLDEPETGTSSPSVRTADPEVEGCQQECSQQLVPRHLRQLLILLLQQAADSGHAQELIWTPTRLAEWLADHEQAPYSSCSTSSGSAEAAAGHHAGSLSCIQQPVLPYMHLLPLVSSVVASKAQFATAADSSSASDTCDGLMEAWATALDPVMPSSSCQQPSASCAEQAQPQAAEAGELTVCPPPQQQGLFATALEQDADQAPMPNSNLEQEVAGDATSAQSHQQQQDQTISTAHVLLQEPSAPADLTDKPTPPAAASQAKQQQQPQLLPLLQQLHGLHQAAAGKQCSSRQQPQDAASRVQPAATAQLPRKEALPGDYEAVEGNPAWDAAAYKRAAAAAALRLGLPQPDMVSGHVSCAASSTAGAADTANSSSSTQVPPGGEPAQQHTTRVAQGPRFGVLMLVHEKGVTAADVWESWECLHAGKAVVRVHLKAGVTTAGLPGASWINCRQLPSRICSQWGCISLTGAILQAAADLLQQHPELQHIALVSGQDLPVTAVPKDLRPGLSLFGRFQFGRAFDDAARQVARELLQQQLAMNVRDAKAWGDALVFHHTWMVLDRQLVLALISQQEDILHVGTVLNERFMQPDIAVAADEFILVTAAMRYGFVKQVVQKKLQPYMCALRRQHRQHSAGAARQQKQERESPHEAAPDHRAAKQQRVGSFVHKANQAGSQQGLAGAGLGSRSGRSLRASSASRSSMDNSGDRPDSPASRSSSRTRAEVPGPPRSRSAPAAAAPSRSREPGGSITASSSSSSKPIGQGLSGRRPPTTRSASAQHAASSSRAAAEQCSPLFDGTFGVLLDCCPTLALFHPTQTRHPHEWRNFTECLLVDINSTRPGNHRLTLLQALGLAQPNSALFFRKVAQMQRQAPAQLMSCLKLLWKNKSLPPTVEELPE